MDLKTFKSSCVKWFLSTILILSVFSFQGLTNNSSINGSIDHTTVIVIKPDELRQTIFLYRVAVPAVNSFKNKSYFFAQPFLNLIKVHNRQIQHFL